MTRGLLSGAFSIALATTPARADEPVEPVRLAYDAPGGCPTESEVQSSLAEKLGQAAMAAPDQLARRLEIRIEQVESGFRARLELVDRAGNRVSRDVTSPTCAQAAQAIALMAALAAKAQRPEEEITEPAQPVEPPPAAPPDPERVFEPRLSEPAPAPTDPSRNEVLLSLGAASGVGPGLAPGIGLGVRRSFGQNGPALVLGVNVHDSFRRETSAAQARFRRLAAGLAVCPLEPELSRSVALAPCAGFELGSHWGRAYADGERVVQGRSDARFFAQALLALRIRLRFEPVVVELGPEVGLPLVHNEFALQPDEPVYEVPAVTAAGRAAIGLIF